MSRFRATVFTVMLIMIILFLFSLKSSDLTTSVIQLKNTMLLSHHSSISGSQRLKEVLRAASMSTRTVILTIVDKSWATTGSILDLFLESFQIGENTKQLLNNIIVVCSDAESLHYCKTVHTLCFHLQTKAILYDAKGSFSYPALDHLRNHLLLRVLHFGYNVVYTEADVMWVRNPFPLFHPTAEVTIGCDSFSSGGFFHLKAHVVSIEFLVLWNLINVLYPDTNNKSICAMVTNYGEFKKIGTTTHFIDTKYYGGFCESNKDISNIYTMHANCCDDIQKKIHDLNIFLDDSRNKQVISKGVNLHLLSVVAGNSPMKCLTT